MTIKVNGMTCEHCASAVKKALLNIPGVKNVTVNLKTGEVFYEENSPVNLQNIKSEIVRAGFDVSDKG